MSTDPAPASGSSADRRPASHSTGHPANQDGSDPAPHSGAARPSGSPARSGPAGRSGSAGPAPDPGTAAATAGRFPRRPDPRRRTLANVIALGAAALSVLIFLLLRPATPPHQPTATPSLPATVSSSAPATEPAAITPDADVAKTKPMPGTEPESSPDAFPGIEELNSPATSIRDDLILLSNVFASWQTLFPQEGNPWGDNRDITAALSGRNTRQVALIPPSHPAISSEGELRDRWGTPVLFHQLSGTAMELRSAGPDRVFYTADDTVLTP